jgi:hypothetical protein
MSVRNFITVWKGVIISYSLMVLPSFRVSTAYPNMQPPVAEFVSGQCCKAFNTDILPGYRPCPWSTEGGGIGNSASCDYFFNSPNGCPVTTCALLRGHPAAAERDQRAQGTEFLTSSAIP